MTPLSLRFLPLVICVGFAFPALAQPAATAQPDSAASGNAVPEASAPNPSAPPSPTLSDLGRSLRNYFTEDELSLLFQYMKESVIASFKDEEVSLPPDLSFKLEILLVRMKKESGHYMDNLINQLEKDLKNSLKEKLKPPPIKEQPYIPWQATPWQPINPSQPVSPAQPVNPWLPPPQQ
jgi:hypothetical protein